MRLCVSIFPGAPCNSHTAIQYILEHPVTIGLHIPVLFYCIITLLCIL